MIPASNPEVTALGAAKMGSPGAGTKWSDVTQGIIEPKLIIAQNPLSLRLGHRGNYGKRRLREVRAGLVNFVLAGPS